MNPRRTPLEQKLGTFIRMLASERDGEVVAAARAIVRTLKAAGADIHVLAERVETANGSKLTDGEMRKLYGAGYDTGVRAAEARQHGPDDFRNVDGTPAWHEIARFLPAKPRSTAIEGARIHQRHGVANGLARANRAAIQMAAQVLCRRWDDRTRCSPRRGRGQAAKPDEISSEARVLANDQSTNTQDGNKLRHTSRLNRNAISTRAVRQP